MSKLRAAPAGKMPGSSAEGSLERGVLSPVEVLAQSVAQIAPSAVVGAVVALVVGIVGPASWVAWSIGVALLMITGYALSRLAVRYSSSGGLYSLAAKAGGPTAGYFVAVGSVIAYLVAAPALVFQLAEFTAGFLHLPAFGVPDNHLTALIIGLAGLLGAGWLAYTGVRVAARAMLVIEVFSMLAITVLMLIVLFTHPGGVFNHAELTLHGLSFHTLLLAAPLIIFAAAGFESSSVLGEEARQPNRAVPLAMIGSIVIVGIFLIFCSYVLVLAFQGSRLNITESTDALADAASIAGVSWYGYVVDAGVIVSMFAVLIAIYNSCGRLLYTLAREGLGPRAFGRSHPRHGTPSAAVLFTGAVNLVALLIVAGIGASVVNAFGDLATLSGYGINVMYLVAAIAVVICFGFRAGRRSLPAVVAAVVAAVILGYVLYTSFRPFPPFPPFPLRVYLLIFCGTMLAAIAGYFWLRYRAPGVLARTGSLAGPARDPREGGVPRA
jgi:amino acid transporter